jgi:hypothetical protein
MNESTPRETPHVGIFWVPDLHDKLISKLAEIPPKKTRKVWHICHIVAHVSPLQNGNRANSILMVLKCLFSPAVY